MRLPYLDGLRGLCALYVVLHHASDRILVPGIITPWIAVVNSLLGYGHIAVTIFILLSGFVLGLQVADDRPFNAVSFLQRRWWRIVPPLYAVTLLAIPLAWCRFKLIGVDWMPEPQQMLFNFLLLNDVFPDWQLGTSPLWTVALEVKIYCLFPVLVWLYRRKGALTAAVAALLVSAIACWLNHLSGVGDMNLWYIALFVLSFLAAQKALPSPKLLAVLSGGLSISLLLRFPVWVAWDDLNHYHRHLWETDLAIGLLAASLFQMQLEARSTSVFERWLSLPLLTGLGTFSYSLYLVHSPVMRLWQAVSLPWVIGNRPFVFFISVALSVLAGWLFYWLIERHFINYRGTEQKAPL